MHPLEGLVEGLMYAILIILCMGFSFMIGKNVGEKEAFDLQDQYCEEVRK